MRIARARRVARVPLAAAVVLFAAAVTPAAAQARGAASFPRVEIGGGGAVAGALSLGNRDANLLTNDPAGTAFRLFATSTELRTAAAAELRLGYRLTPRLTAEGRLTFSRPSLRGSISLDSENAAPVEASSRLTEYVIEGGALWRLSTEARRRWIPFVNGGAGVARHVHEDNVRAENGVSGYAGAGALYAIGAPRTPAARRTGLRFDVRLQLVHGGIAGAAGLSTRVVATAGAFLAF
jgi:hypothetical protein